MAVAKLKGIDYVNISVFGFGLAALSTSLGQIVLPMRILDVAPEELKNTYLGILTFLGMAIAMVVQPAVGFISDRTTLPWGRRRPYMALGTVAATALMVTIGVASSYFWLVVTAVVVQMFANVAQNPYDAVVKDRVPANQRGQVSSLRAISGAAGAIIFVLMTGLFMDRHAPNQRDLWLWLSLLLPASFMTITMVWTMFTVKENGHSPIQGREKATTALGGDGTHPQLKRILVAGFFFTLAAGILQTYTLFFLRDVVEVENPASALGILAIAVGLSLLVTLYPAGLLADRLGRRPLLILSAGLGSVGSILFILAQALTQVVLIGIILGMSVGIFMSAGRALIVDMVSEHRAALQLGVANVALMGGLAVAKLAGVAIDALNKLSENLGYYSMLGVSAAGFLIGALLVSALKHNQAVTVAPRPTVSVESRD